MSIYFLQRPWSKDEEPGQMSRDMLISIKEVGASSIVFSYPSIKIGVRPTTDVKEIRIDLKDFFIPNTYRRIFIDVFGRPLVADMATMMNSRLGQQSFTSSHESIPSDHRKFTISVSYGQTPDDCYTIVQGMITSDVDVDVKVAAHATKALVDLCGETHPWVVAVQKTWESKRYLLSSIEPLESLSSLEKQVDVLTDLVVAMATDGDADKLALLNRYLEHKSYDSNDSHDEAIAIKKRLRDTISQYKSQK